jgi:hypothetical protein
MAVVLTTGAGNATGTVASSGTSITVAKPANVANGDLLLACVYNRNSDAGWSSVPSGWTLVASQPTPPAGSGFLAFYTKAIPSAAGETATDYTWSAAASTGRMTAVINRVTGAHATAVNAVSATAATQLGTGTSSTITCPAATTTVANTIVISAVAANTTSNDQTYMTVPSGTTLAAQVVTNTGGSNTQLQLAQNEQSTAASTGSKQWTTTGSLQASGVGFLIVVRPTSTPPTVTAPALVYQATNLPISLQWDAHSSGSTIADVVVTQVSNGAPTLTLSGTGVAARTATPTAPGLYEFSAVATDGDGVTSDPSIGTVAIYSPSGDAVAQAVLTNTDAWTNVGGVDITEAITDAANTDYAQSPEGPSDDAITYRMQPLRPGGARIKIRHRLQPVAGDATNCTVDVLQGASNTQVATETFALDDDWVDDELVLDSGENTAFNNHAVWAVRITADQP